MKRSVMLTGAPVTGKSTITRSLRGESGFVPFPDYTTRPIRSDEIDGVDKTFVSREAFVELHNTGKIIEPTLEYCDYQGNYYGSPTEWLSTEELGEQKVITCVAVKIAGLIRRANPDLVWVHLEADDTERAQRLALRGITHAEVTRRMANVDGDSLFRPVESDLIINTSQTPLDATVGLILGATE